MAIIRLQHGKVQKLASDFGVSLPTVRKALRGETTTALANMLRKAALERGGRQYTETSKS